MQKNNRFIKFPLWLFEWEWVSFEGYAVAFLKMVQKANKTPTRWQGVDINCGEFITSFKSLSELCGMTEQKTRTFLKRCIDSGLVEKTSCSSFTKIKICDFDFFQGNSSKINMDSNIKLTQQPTRSPTYKKEPSNSSISQKNDDTNHNANMDTNMDANTKLTRLPTYEQHTANMPLTTELEYIDNIENNIDIKEVEDARACARTRETTTAPTLPEIRSFCLERDSIVDPARFYNYYCRIGWDKCGDWRLKVEEWETNTFSNGDRERVEKLKNYRSFERGTKEINLNDFAENF